jgi:hypothetical protein
MVEAWHSLLSDVETRHLFDVYRYALKARTAEIQPRPMTANEMRFVVDQKRRGLIYARGEWLDEMLYDESGMYYPRKLVM